MTIKEENDKTWNIIRISKYYKIINILTFFDIYNISCLSKLPTPPHSAPYFFLQKFLLHPTSTPNLFNYFTPPAPTSTNPPTPTLSPIRLTHFHHNMRLSTLIHSHYLVLDIYKFFLDNNLLLACQIQENKWETTCFSRNIFLHIAHTLCHVRLLIYKIFSLGK